MPEALTRTVPSVTQRNKHRWILLLCLGGSGLVIGLAFAYGRAPVKEAKLIAPEIRLVDAKHTPFYPPPNLVPDLSGPNTSPLAEAGAVGPAGDPLNSHSPATSWDSGRSPSATSEDASHSTVNAGDPTNAANDAEPTSRNVKPGATEDPATMGGAEAQAAAAPATSQTNQPSSDVSLGDESAQSPAAEGRGEGGTGEGGTGEGGTGEGGTGEGGTGEGGTGEGGTGEGGTGDTNLPEESLTFRSCDAAYAAGVAPILKGEPGYSTRLDRDDDGVACELNLQL